MTRTKKMAKGLVAALILAQFVVGIPFSRHSQSIALAQSGGAPQKLSSSLRDKLHGGGPQERVRVIVQRSALESEFLASVRNLGGAVRRSYANLNHVALELPAAMVEALAERHDVDFVSEDRPIQVSGHLETTTGAAKARTMGTLLSGPIDGSSIGIAILDSGIYSAHHSFNTGRVVASVDFTGEDRTDDPFGHGTHVASIAAGNNHVSSGGYTGMAPGAKLINVRVLDSNGEGSISDAIAGIDWCITKKGLYNIRVLNISFGAVAVDSYANDPLCQAVRRAFDAGMVVCVAAGNSGKDAAGNKIYGAIHSPGIEPSAITVGASNTMATDGRLDDVVTTYSSRGPTRGYVTDSFGQRHYDNLIKPDLVAPGNKIIEAQSPNNQLVATTPSLDADVSSSPYHEMMYMSGTSMATPCVAGAAALVLERNSALTPNLVKAILEYTAQPLSGFDTLEQGAGQLNIEGAVRLAGQIRTGLSLLSPGSSLLNSSAPTQSTTIANTTFVWAGGLIQNWNIVYGSDLILKYQGIYGAGVLLTSGVMLTNGTLLTNGTMLTNGTLLTAGTLLSNGTLLSSGTLFVSGTLLSNGTVLTDGTLLSNGTLLSSGVLISDCYLAASMSMPTATSMALAALAGDPTACMLPSPDANPGN